MLLRKNWLFERFLERLSFTQRKNRKKENFKKVCVFALSLSLSFSLSLSMNDLWHLRSRLTTSLALEIVEQHCRLFWQVDLSSLLLLLLLFFELKTETKTWLLLFLCGCGPFFQTRLFSSGSVGPFFFFSLFYFGRYFIDGFALLQFKHRTTTFISVPLFLSAKHTIAPHTHTHTRLQYSFSFFSSSFYVRESGQDGQNLPTLSGELSPYLQLHPLPRTPGQSWWTHFQGES